MAQKNNILSKYEIIVLTTLKQEKKKLKVKNNNFQSKRKVNFLLILEHFTYLEN